MLLQQLYNPRLSDRRLEGSRCSLPDGSFGHVHKLRDLLKQEEIVLREREEQFLNDLFATECEGAADGCLAGPRRALQPRPELLTSPALAPLLRAAEPLVDRALDDGARLRAYRLGALELRTVTEPGGDEVVGAVFSAPTATMAAAARLAAEDRIVKVVEYVERGVLGLDARCTDARSQRRFYRRYFVLFETATGGAILTERRRDGCAVWVEQPADLGERRALGRVQRFADLSSGAGATVGETAARYAREVPGLAAGSMAASRRRRYAHEAFAWAFAADGPPRRALAVLRQGRQAAGMAATQRASRLSRAAGCGGPLPQAGRLELRLAAAPHKNVFSGLFAD